MPFVVELHVPASSDACALVLRPWRTEDMPALVAEMDREYPTRGLWGHPDDDRPDRPDWTGPRDEQEAREWLAGQDRGWRDGDWLTFVVLEVAETGDPAATQRRLAGHVALKNREAGGRVGEKETAEIGFWTAAGLRGRGIAPAAALAVTAWAFDKLGAAAMRQIMLVHDVDNPASCRVAEKAGYPLKELSPAKPPYWFTDGHIHMRTAD
jgi:RimJ/RimL family protein N-acetyltransferase